MINFSKTTLLIILLIIFVIVAGFFAYQWWQVKGELAKQIEENENLMKQMDELQKEIEKLRTAQIGDETIKDKEEVTIATDKIEYRQGQKVRITIKNNSEGKSFSWEEWNNPFSYLDLQKYENGNWIFYPGEDFFRGGPFLSCPCDVMSCELDVTPPLSPGESIETEWGQTVVWCEGFEEKMKNVSLGKYKFALYYFDGKGKTTYSNEFTIK